jgi:hypothetical protein
MGLLVMTKRGKNQSQADYEKEVGIKQDKTSTAKTPAHKAMKYLYKEGVKNKGEETARKLAGLAFNRSRRSTSNGYMSSVRVKK